MARFPIPGYSGPVNNHWGTGERGAVDLFAPAGTPVVAPETGIVVDASYSAIGGYNATIRSASGLLMYFAHLKDLFVESGQPIAEGERVGTVGDTGNAAGTGPHLHLGVGRSIKSGGGAGGGAGTGFDAVDWLRGLLGLSHGVNDDDDPPLGDIGIDLPGSPRPTPAPGVAPTPTTPTYSGKIFGVTFGGPGGWVPTGIGLDPGFVGASTGWIQDRLIPFLIGLLIAIIGLVMLSRGTRGTRVLGIELVIVGGSLLWWAINDTVDVALEALKP